jgi:hypothetical protein
VRELSRGGALLVSVKRNYLPPLKRLDQEGKAQASGTVVNEGGKINYGFLYASRDDSEVPPPLPSGLLVKSVPRRILPPEAPVYYGHLPRAFQHHHSESCLTRYS